MSAVCCSQRISSVFLFLVPSVGRYSIRGAVWFQGEHNVVTGTSRERYACIFGGMINDWRDAWKGIGDFPFLWAQLAPYTGCASLLAVLFSCICTMHRNSYC